MNKPCSERAWGPLLPRAPTSPPPQIKEIWVSAWLLPLYAHPLLTPGIILTRVELIPCKTPSFPALSCLQAGLLDHRLSVFINPAPA